MTQGFRFFTLVVVFHLVAATPGAFAQERTNPAGGRQAEITIWVYNYAEVPIQTVAKTKTQITKILNRAGVTARWIDCPASWIATEDQSACQEHMSSSELAIMIFHTFKPPHGMSRDTQLGSAEVLSNRQPGHYIYLSYDHIRESAYPGGFCSPETLAEVAVHEIAHVLFRSTDHSPTGLMRARWDRPDFQNAAIGNLFFTPQQAETLQAEVSARMKQAAVQESHAGNIAEK